MKKKLRGVVAILVAVMSLSMIAPTAVFAADSLAAPVQISENETETLPDEETDSVDIIDDADAETNVDADDTEVLDDVTEESSEEVRTSEAEEETTAAEKESTKEEMVVIHEGPWDGTTKDTNFNGTGTEADPYLIQSASQLAGLAANVNGGEKYSGQYFKLTTDIDLNNKEWTPIGISASYYFGGSFNGDGHRISNLYINASTTYQALFGYVRTPDNSTTVVLKNFIVDGSVTNTKSYTAGVLAYGTNNVTIQNVGNEADVTCTASNGQYTGGVAGYLAVSSGTYSILVDSCYNKGNITASYNRLGGLCGGISRSGSNTSLSVTNCYNAGKVTGNHANANYNQFGGLIGYGYGSKTTPLTVSNNFNIGEVYWKSGSYVTGGIFGNTTATYVTPSNNYYLTDIYYYDGTAKSGCAIGSSSSTTEGYPSFTASEGLKAESLGAAFADGNTYTISVGGVDTNVTVPVLSWEGTFYEVTFDCTHATTSLGTSTSVKEGNTATFTVIPDAEYIDPVVKIGSETLTPDGDGVYTIPAVNAPVTITITATQCSHTGEIENIEAKEPDCTQTGLKECVKCKTCGQYFADESCTELLTEDQVIIPANGHTFDKSGKCLVCGVQKTWDGTSVNEPKLDEDGKTFLISEAEELAWFRNQINSNITYKEYNLRLTSDIFLSDKSWTPIALSSSESPWTGNFYGDGHTIHGLNVDYESSAYSKCYAGLIGQYGGSLIENLNVEGKVKYCYSYSNSATGGIVGYAMANSCVFNNCTFNGTVESDSYGGGILGRGTTGTTIVNCGVVGDIASSKTTSSYAGGIVGKTGPTSGNSTRGTVANCYFRGTVSGALYNYGIGYATYAIDFDNCYATNGGTCPDSATGITATNMYTSAQAAATLNANTSDTKTALEEKGLKYNTWYDHAGGADFIKIECAHENLTHHDAVKKTCTTDGNKEYWSCDNCGTLFLDDAAEQETTLDNVTIKAGHEWTDKVTKEATCADGEKTYTCSLCNDTYTEVIPGTGNHTYKASDNKDGETHTYKCSVCGETKPGGYAAGSAVTSFEAGKKYVIVTDDSYAMSSKDCSLGNTLRAGVAYDSSAITEDIVWTYEEGGYLSNDGKYLNADADGIKLQISADKDSALTWVISGKNLLITNQTNYNTLCYNNFNNYIYFGRSVTGGSMAASLTVYEVTISTVTENHTFGDGVTKEETCGEAGSITYTCTACDATKVTEIPATGEHAFEDGFCTNCDSLDPDAETYVVKSANHLVKVSESAAEGNSFAGKTVKLSANISLADIADWTPIGGSITKHDLTLASQEDLVAALDEHFIIYDNTGTSYVRGSDKNGKYDSARTYFYQTGSTFDGIFDGAGYAVTDMTVNTANGYAGFFGAVKGTVKNLTVSGSVTSTTSQDYVGGIVGKLEAGGTIDGCTSNVAVTANNAFNIGGIVGAVGEFGVFVSDEYPMATVSNCVNNGNVRGYVRTGGIVGRNAGTVKNCANHGTVFNVSGQKKGTGGIVGMNGVNNAAKDAGIVTGCYNDGYVDCNNGFWTGGIVGFQNAKSVTEYSYNAGLLRVSMSATGAKLSYVNPVVGNNEGTVNFCLWLNKETGDNTANYVGIDTTGVGSGTVNNVKGVTEDELKAVSSVKFLNNEEVTNFKEDCGNYPALLFETATEHTFDDGAVDKEATCGAEGSMKYTCKTCGTEKFEAISATGAHNYEIKNAKQATCTEDGYTGDVICSVCGDQIVTGSTIKGGHKEVTDKAVPATCSSTGLTEGSHCSVCGEVIKKQDVVSMKEHTPVTDAAVSATCEHSGLTEGSHCSVCDKVLVAQERVERLEHNLEMTGYITPTCTQTGYTGNAVCTLCNKVVMKGTVIPMTSHASVADKGYAATCEEDGLTDGAHCVICETVTKTQDVIPAPGHKEVVIPGYPATATNTGLTDGIECSVCGKVIKAQEVIPKLAPDGWNLIDGKYYFYKDGEVQYGWISDSGKTYYTDLSTGVRVEGLKKVDGVWYYFNPNGKGEMLTGLQKMNGYWRYFDPATGRMQTGLQQINGYWRYFEAGTGRMLTGLQKIDGSWYYFESGTGRMQTGLQKINSFWRYFDPATGKMQTGLQQINGYWRYFDEETGRMQTGFQTINGKTYYFETEKGRALTGTQTINGKTYTFDKNGVLVK